MGVHGKQPSPNVSARHTRPQSCAHKNNQGPHVSADHPLPARRPQEIEQVMPTKNLTTALLDVQ